MTAYLPPPAPIPWVRPDTRPFTGTPAEAMRLLIRDGFPAGIVRAQFDRLAAGRCRAGTIGQGETFVAMLFGRDEIEHGVVADTDRWSLTTNRAAVVCGAERAGYRYELWIPAACGNFSERVIPLGLPPWGEAFAPPAVIEGIGGPLYGGGGELLGASGPLLGASATLMGAFGAWTGGIGSGFLVSQSKITVQRIREVSFASPSPPPIERAAFEVERRHTRLSFRRLWERRWFRRVSVPPGTPIPPIPTPPNTPTPPSVPVPEPSSAALLLTALAAILLVRIRGEKNAVIS